MIKKFMLQSIIKDNGVCYFTYPCGKCPIFNECSDLKDKYFREIINIKYYNKTKKQLAIKKFLKNYSKEELMENLL